MSQVTATTTFYQNLLTRVEKPAATLVASYAYDALGRRIEKDVNGGDVTRFYYDDQRNIEESDDAATPDVLRQYVWGGQCIDELLVFRDVVGAGDTANADYLVLSHHNFNEVALIARTSGGVVERYDYNPYGERTVFFSPAATTWAATPRPPSAAASASAASISPMAAWTSGTRG